MGFAKQMMEEQESMCDKARRIAVQAGVLAQCEPHGEFFRAGEDIEEAFKLAETMASSEGFDLAEMQEYIKAEVEENCIDGCVRCADLLAD